MNEFFTGFVVGLVVLATVLGLAPTTCSLGRNALAECEKSIPRNQTCEITAKPKELK